MNELAPSLGVAEPKARVHVFTLGGTIAAQHDPGGSGAGVVPTATAPQLLRMVSVNDAIAVTASDFSMLPSGDLQVEDLAVLAVEIDRILEGGSHDRPGNGGIDGVVVTQGTDTMEEAGYLLSLLVTSKKPVIVTGAMRNPTVAGSDGPANLLAAITVAGSPVARELGCVVLFNDQLHDPRWVRKTHTSNVAAFSSAPAGPIGWVSEGSLVLIAHPDRPIPIIATGRPELPAVALLTCGFGDDGRIADALLGLGFHGVVVEALGGGHVSKAAAERLVRLATEVPVILASRTGGPVLSQTYGFIGSEIDLLSRGLLSAALLDGRKARVLLTLLLRAGLRGPQLAVEFSRRAQLTAAER